MLNYFLRWRKSATCADYAIALRFNVITMKNILFSARTFNSITVPCSPARRL